jgi:hypothetical protein
MCAYFSRGRGGPQRPKWAGFNMLFGGMLSLLWRACYYIQVTAFIRSHTDPGGQKWKFSHIPCVEKGQIWPSFDPPSKDVTMMVYNNNRVALIMLLVRKSWLLGPMFIIPAKLWPKESNE